ncbi:MAG: NADH-quinone oxidoreductase subunit NuoG [Betaproteobacteria bacterium]|nr:NADH-quinone oxidoreductase subunit NuoG [Aquincola sp.]MDH5221241.1 NADH-quinone oxidoreductase subunit NuoG [Betaproteobacteria bacterium]MDH5351545.1 NADH-quinone oxidoreductase subunit NuoG [Betaproteobacteria bacterium]
MPTLEIDGKAIEVAAGTSVIEAAKRLGIFIPHFCYHPKLSVAANCRMCLVEVEKAPKPMPACATPVADGMKIWTQSPAARKAQNGVMEFLLINHPLDCPICDQGGECQLQDLSVGYGGSASRYQEEKRVVLHKDLGPLVAAEEMSRCIQCTRCVRFGEEIGGVMELGMINRGEHAEIVSFIGRSVDSELSGNMIDLCPVGALTSKPFRYSARTWELSRRRSVAPHDGLGSNLVVQVKQNRVMRVLPLENGAVNECWLSDKDRFSYEGLNAPDRLLRPMVRRGGRLEEAEWEEALERAAEGLRDAGVLASPHATLEELYLAGKLGPADFRLRHSDFSADGRRAGIPWLGMPVAELGTLDRVLVVGSFLRKDHPLLAHRMRQAAKRGAQVHVLHSVDDDWLMPLASKTIVAPNALAGAIAAFKERLAGAKNAAVLLGNFAQQHPQAAALHAAAQALGVQLGFLGEAANSVGGYVAGLPAGGGMPEVLKKDALLLLNVEPRLDCADPRAAERARFIVNLSAWRSDVGDVLLPIVPFTETAGTFVSTEGRVQTFNACVLPAGEARPAWKVLRVLGTMLDRPGTAFDTIEEVRSACLAGRDVAALLSNRIEAGAAAPVVASAGLQRIAEVPIYAADPLVRRSPSLQKTRDARPPRAWMNARLLQKLGLAEGQPVLARMQAGQARLTAALDDKLPEDCVRIAAAHAATADLGPMFGTVSVEKASVEKVA